LSEHSGHIEVKMGSERNFGIVFAIVFMIIALWPLVMSGGHVRIWAVAVAVVLTLVAFFLPHVLKWPNKIWFKFGMLLGAIIAPIVMSILYFLAVTPTGIIMRLLRKDLLRTKYDRSADSYWLPRSKPPGTMKNQF